MSNALQSGSGTRRARFVVSYDGTPFRGFADNDDVRTVMGEFRAAVERVLRQPVELTGAGRTDAGVHAWGQVISGDLPGTTDLDDLAHRVNQLCRPSIAIRSFDWAEPDFDARFSATWRQYRYHVWNDPAPNPLLHHLTWYQRRRLNLDKMQTAADAIVGEHDFTSFCRKPKLKHTDEEPSMTRIVYEATWNQVDDERLVRFEIRGSAFCHQMVRSLVGTMVDIGLGVLPERAMPDILAARDRSAAGTVAPPQGLVLWAVGYDGDRWDHDVRP